MESVKPARVGRADFVALCHAVFHEELFVSLTGGHRLPGEDPALVSDGRFYPFSETLWAARPH